MSADEYTPTMARVEDLYSWAVAWKAYPPIERPDLAVSQESQRAEFRRALAAHDAEVARAAKAGALEEARDVCQRIQDDTEFGGNGSGRIVSAKLVIGSMAAEYRKVATDE